MYRKLLIASLPLALLTLVLIPSNAAHATQTTYTTPGSHSWTAPAGVYSVTVELWGAGAGGGGGGGAYSGKNSYSVTPGSSYTVYVGSAAQDSSFVSSSTVLAKGGSIFGTGGQASAGVGDVKYSGGNAGSSGCGGSCWGAGGGGGAGSAGDGGNGFGAGYGIGGSPDGGRGGSGGDDGGDVSCPAPPEDGVAPGGGGGGAASGCGGYGFGAPGQAILTYTPVTFPPPPPRFQLLGGFFRLFGGSLRLR